MTTFTVLSTDSLSSIALRFYGNASLWPRIFEANRDRILDPDVIADGLVLNIPDAVNTATPTPAGAYVFPVQGYMGGVPLHWDSHHGAADLFAAQGTPVVAMCDGLVKYVGTEATDRFGGNNVFYTGDDGLDYYYAHGDRPASVQAGQRVTAGHVFFGVGDTGNAKGLGHHLHIGIGYGIQSGTGPAGGAGKDFDAVELMRRTLSNPGIPMRVRRILPFKVLGSAHLGLTVHSQPSSASSVVGTFQDGVELEAEASLVTAEAREWRHVTAPVDGWAPSQFLVQATETLTNAPPAGSQDYVVRSGDSLATIAQQFYGNSSLWPRIFEANRGRIQDPNVIRTGMTLSIPSGSSPAPPPPPPPAAVATGILSVPALFALVRRLGAPSVVDRIMVAAALTESGGNPAAIGDSGHSAGLWQMHDLGLGRGMTIEERCNPDVAGGRMLPQFNYWYNQWAAQGLFGEDLAARTYLWTERPYQYNVPGSQADVNFRAKWRTVPAV